MNCVFQNNSSPEQEGSSGQCTESVAGCLRGLVHGLLGIGVSEVHDSAARRRVDDGLPYRFSDSAIGRIFGRYASVFVPSCLVAPPLVDAAARSSLGRVHRLGVLPQGLHSDCRRRNGYRAFGSPRRPVTAAYDQRPVENQRLIVSHPRQEPYEMAHENDSLIDAPAYSSHRFRRRGRVAGKRPVFR